MEPGLDHPPGLPDRDKPCRHSSTVIFAERLGVEGYNAGRARGLGDVRRSPKVLEVAGSKFIRSGSDFSTSPLGSSSDKFPGSSDNGT